MIWLHMQVETFLFIRLVSQAIENECTLLLCASAEPNLNNKKNLKQTY